MADVDFIKYETKYEKEIKDKIIELFKDTGARIMLFGSRARGERKRGSDFDIGFEQIEPDEFRRRKIQFDLFWEESIVPNKVDLVLFDTANPDFVKEAKKDIVVWKSC